MRAGAGALQSIVERDNEGRSLRRTRLPSEMAADVARFLATSRRRCSESWMDEAGRILARHQAMALLIIGCLSCGWRYYFSCDVKERIGRYDRGGFSMTAGLAVVMGRRSGVLRD